MSSKIGRSRRSMATWMAAWYAFSSSFLLIVATTSLYRSIVAGADAEGDSYLDDGLDHLEAEYARVGRIDEDPDDFWEDAARIVDLDGNVLHETANAATRLPPASTVRSGAADYLAPNGRWFRVKSRRVGPRIYEVGFDRTREFEVLGRYRRNMWFILVPSIAASAAVGVAIARRGLRPLGDIAATARRIGPSRLAERITLQDLPAELHDLAGTFNAMLSRLQASFERLERFSADIAHELRTPVHSLRNVAEVTLQSEASREGDREALTTCLESADRLSRLIERLLFLARAEDPARRPAVERLDVAREIEAVCDFFEASATEAGVTLCGEASRPIAFPLERALFQRALGNLIANALAHTPPGGRITVSARLDRSGLAVTVSDTGCGMAAEHLPRLFDRFYRVEAPRSPGQGVGLGLAIVRSIAELHGGSVSAESGPGVGTTIALQFPGRDGAEAAAASRGSNGARA